MSPAPHPLEPDDHRRARLLFVLKSLTDRGHGLAMKAADKAETQLDTPDPEPDQATPSAPNHHQTFERYARLVRLLATAEHRIATYTAPARRSYRPALQFGPEADPRRPKLRQFIHDLTTKSPDRAELRSAATESIDDALDRDPARTAPTGAILEAICKAYGLPFDLEKLPDDFLETPITGPPDHIPR